MKTKYNLKNALLIISCVLGFSQLLSAQSNYQVNDSKSIEMKLSGTSTLHDWVMNSQIVTGEAQFEFKAGTENQLAALNSLTFSLVVLNLKSDSKGLDKNAYKALKSGQYKNINYKLTSAVITPVKDNQYTLKTQGNLTIAGVTKAITMDVNCQINSDGIIVCTGTYKLNMTDYQVIPPTFMFGVMKTGDAITLDFNIAYKKQKGI